MSYKNADLNDKNTIIIQKKKEKQSRQITCVRER